MNLTGKRVMVAGSGISGIGAAKLLAKIGADVVIYDGNKEVNKEELMEKLPQEYEFEIVLGEMTKALLDGISLMVVSPGIALDAPCMELAKQSGIEIWGEIELAYRFSKGRLAAITGTNGKTTTTSLTGEIMKSCFESVFVVGNIGNPYTEAALSTVEDSVTIAEISSFQLETVHEFAPQISAILNITPDHLNRHKTIENYIRIKESITKNQSEENICILNYEEEILRNFGKTLSCRVIYFSSQRKLDEGICLHNSRIVYMHNGEEIPVCRVAELKLLGTHNVENVMAAAAIAFAMGVPAEKISETVKSFRAVEHRIEFIREHKEVYYYNDSKGTNPDASIKAIQAMERPTVLIAGGYDKDSDFREYVRAFAGKVHSLILLGATKQKIADAARAEGFEEIIMTESLKEAVDMAARRAAPGDAVLLSPACASWDMFKSYEERGNRFREFVDLLS